MSPNGADGMANSVDPDQEQSVLVLHCLPRHICQKTSDHYDTHRKTALTKNVEKEKHHFIFAFSCQLFFSFQVHNPHYQELIDADLTGIFRTTLQW